MVTKKTFCIVLLHLFSIKFHGFVSTVGFSNEDNCCQLQGIGKLIKEKLLKGIFRVDLIDIAGNTDFVKSIANICEQMTNFFTSRVLFGVKLIFFPELCFKVGGAVYTRVQLIHKSLRFFSIPFTIIYL